MVNQNFEFKESFGEPLMYSAALLVGTGVYCLFFVTVHKSVVIRRL